MASEVIRISNTACRVCMADKGKINIFENCGNNEQLIYELMMMVTSLEISENDGLPGNICKKCLAELKIAFSFKRKCEESHKQYTCMLKIVVNDDKDKSFHSEKHFNDSIEKEIELINKEEDVCIKNELSIEDRVEPLCILNYNNIDDFTEVPSQNMKIKDINHYEYNCESCEKLFVSKKDLKKHLRKHTEIKSFQCRVCCKIFRQNSHLQRHLLIHTGMKPFECDICNKSFKQKPHLTRHMSVHTGLKPFQCEICGKNFITTSDLNKHSVTHTGSRPFQCEVCGKSYNNTSDLNKHLTRKHSHDLNRFICAVCQIQCKTKKALNQHMLVHCDTGDIWTKLDEKSSGTCVTNGLDS